MAQRRPYISYNKKGFDFSSVGYTMPTYEEVRASMRKLLEDSDDKKVSVYRSKRGCWGEWFENWEFNAERKPRIVKQGWM